VRLVRHGGILDTHRLKRTEATSCESRPANIRSTPLRPVKRGHAISDSSRRSVRLCFHLQAPSDAVMLEWYDHASCARRSRWRPAARAIEAARRGIGNLGQQTHRAGGATAYPRPTVLSMLWREKRPPALNVRVRTTAGTIQPTEEIDGYEPIQDVRCVGERNVAPVALSDDHRRCAYPRHETKFPILAHQQCIAVHAIDMERPCQVTSLIVSASGDFATVALVAAKTAIATVDQSDTRGSVPHNRDPSGAVPCLGLAARVGPAGPPHSGASEDSPFRVPLGHHQCCRHSRRSTSDGCTSW
jgi:hypothetical protein